MASPKQKPASSGGSIEQQLREEIKQLTEALDQTDQALDEWVAECEKLQKVLKAKDNEIKSFGVQLEELKQHAFKLEEERNQLRATKSSNSTSSSARTVTDSSDTQELKQLRQANEALREQLTQSQQWVKEGLAKLEKVNNIVDLEKKKVQTIEKEKEALMSGQKATIEQERDKALWESSRLASVVHAHELEIAALRAKLEAARTEQREAEVLAGKTQALCTVAKFQAENASTENDAVVHWLKSAVRWSARL